VSAYRSYDAQVAAYEENRAIHGDDVDRFSARPGHSEHQLGTTVDVSSASAAYALEGFEGTPEAEWVATNSWRFGFIVSYPEGKEEVTGYAYEPWHIRYVGKETAAAVRQSGLTLPSIYWSARWAGALVLLALALIRCGDDGAEPTPTPPQTETAGPTETPQPTATPTATAVPPTPRHGAPAAG
jgi:hypothetical protein